MKNLSACTSVLVGKDASVDGSTMIARNDDTFLPLTPQRFISKPAYHDENDLVWHSNQNGFTAKMPSSGQRFLLTPNADVEKEGVYAESGFNEKNVAMSATESVYGNLHALAYDPWVPDGLAEDSLQSMVLPYIDSAKDGVKYLGNLIKEYGSPEGNGVLFADHDQVWYMEIVTGHHWVAQRIPDDCVAVAANQVAIQEVTFGDPDNFLYSDGIQEFVEAHHLNPDPEGFNFRHIFGTSNEKDRFYNTPRVWYGQKYLNPEHVQGPTSSEMPFIFHANRKLAVTDVEYVLASHYNETDYDPLGKGPENLKTKFRPIAMNRTQNSHVLQLRNDIPEDVSAIMWLNFGYSAFAPYVPFFANVNATDSTYANTPLTMDDTSAYWMYRKLSTIVESHYSHFVQQDRDFKDACNQMFLTHVQATIDGAKDQTELSAYLEQQNQALVKTMREKSHAFMNDLLSQSIELSKLTYNMDKNL